MQCTRNQFDLQRASWIHTHKGYQDLPNALSLVSRGEIWENFCILESPVIAAICIHVNEVSSIFKSTSVTGDPKDEMIGKVAKIIKVDIAKMKHVFRYFTKIELFNGNTRLLGNYKVFYVATSIDIIVSL